MRLLLFHPGPASIDCEDCQRYVYDLERGERKTYRAGGEDRPQVRPPGTPRQCALCPKESPARAAELRLTRANVATLRIYLESRATAGASLTPVMLRDLLLLRNLRIIDGIYRAWEQTKASEALGHQTARLLGAILK